MPKATPSATTVATQALTSLAILKANWNEDRRSYVDNFLPFLGDLMSEGNAAGYSATELQEGLLKRFGLDVPLAALNTMLTRAVRRKLGRRDQVRFFPDLKAFGAIDLTAKLAGILREQAAVVERIRTYATSEHALELSPADAETALWSFIDEHSIGLLRASIVGDPVAPVANSSAPEHAFVIASFIVQVHQRDPECWAYIETLVRGAMLASVLYLPQISEAEARFHKTTLFLDTPVLLSALGYHGAEAKQAATEAFTLAYTAGANLSCFDRTILEVRGVLHGFAMSIGRGRTRNAFAPARVESYFVTSGYQAADVEIAIECVEADLAALHIRVVQRPGYSMALGVDEKQLETLLRNNVNYLQDAAVQHDLDCLTAVYRWRDGEPQARLETCRGVFVTNNTALIRAARTFFGDDEPEGSWPLAILDDDLGTLSWLKNPLGAPDFPRSQIIADAYAALEPRPALWRRYVSEIERLHTNDTLNQSQFFVLRYSLEAKRVLMNLTGGEGADISPDVVHEVLERSESEIQEPVRARLRALEDHTLPETQSALTDAIAELERTRREMAASVEVVQRINAQMLRQRQDAANRAQRHARLIAGVGYVLALAIVLLAAWLALPTSISHVPGVFDGARLPLVIVAVLIVAVLVTLMHVIVGWSLRDLHRKIERGVQEWLRYQRRIPNPENETTA
jgi:hypothetical protein